MDEDPGGRRYKSLEKTILGLTILMGNVSAALVLNACAFDPLGMSGQPSTSGTDPNTPQVESLAITCSGNDCYADVPYQYVACDKTLNQFQFTAADVLFFSNPTGVKIGKNVPVEINSISNEDAANPTAVTSVESPPQIDPQRGASYNHEISLGTILPLGQSLHAVRVGFQNPYPEVSDPSIIYMVSKLGLVDSDGEPKTTLKSYESQCIFNHDDTKSVPTSSSTYNSKTKTGVLKAKFPHKCTVDQRDYASFTVENTDGATFLLPSIMPSVADTTQKNPTVTQLPDISSTLGVTERQSAYTVRYATSVAGQHLEEFSVTFSNITQDAFKKMQITFAETSQNSYFCFSQTTEEALAAAAAAATM